MDVKMTKRGFLGGSLTTLGVFLSGCGSSEAKESFEITKSEAEWRRILSPAAFAVLRKEQTERPRSSPLNAEKRRGIYACAGCARYRRQHQTIDALLRAELRWEAPETLTARLLTRMAQGATCGA